MALMVAKWCFGEPEVCLEYLSPESDKHLACLIRNSLIISFISMMNYLSEGERSYINLLKVALPECAKRDK